MPKFKRISIYDYFLCSDDRNYIPHELIQARDLKVFHKEGVSGWEEEVFFEDSVYWRKNVDSTARREKLPSIWQWLYVTGKVLWDVNADPVKILEDAESKYYGKAYAAMKKYHALRRKLWKEGKNCFGYPLGNERLPLLLNVPAVRDQLFTLLAEAEKLAKGDKKRLARIANDRKFLVKYWVKANEEYKALQGKCVKAPTAATPIILDGKGDEKAWQNAFYVTDFREMFKRKPKKIPPETAASFGILSDSQNLYFLINVKEPVMNKLHTGRTFWEKSMVELFIHPQSVSNEYYHLAFAVNGEKHEARCPGNIRHKIGAEHKIRKTASGYTMEIKVPAWQFGDFRNGANWKCNFSVSRFIFTDKLIMQHYSIGGNLSHDVTRFLPLQIGTPLTINGMFNKVMKNRRKYPAYLKVLEKVPVGWYAALPRKKGAVFGIKQAPPPHDETLYVTKAFASYPLSDRLKGGEKILVSFEAKGKGQLSCAFIRYGRSNNRFIKTEYPAKAFTLQEKWQKFSAAYTMKENEKVTLSFNAFRCEAEIDNVNIIIQEETK